MKLILASTSPYRKHLLEKTGIPFTCENPGVDEVALQKKFTERGMSPFEISEELSYRKGLAVHSRITGHGACLVLSGDQLLQFDSQAIGKPGTPEKAFAQLKMLQGHPHQLITSITLFHGNEVVRHTEVVQLRMRQLSDGEIRNYLETDQPFDCAGSYKIEKSGIALFENIQTHDFTAIEGIPMIWLCNKLKEFKYEFFSRRT